MIDFELSPHPNLWEFLHFVLSIFLSHFFSFSFLSSFPLTGIFPTCVSVKVQGKIEKE